MKKNNLEDIKKKIFDLIDLYSVEYFKDNEFKPGITPIPVSGKVINNLEIKFMTEAALEAWLTTGRFNNLFEKKLSEYIGTKCLLTVNSGSSANLVAFSTLTSPKLRDRAIAKGDEIISVASGFPTTVNPIIQFGAVPVFVDCKLPTYNIDEDLIEEAITAKTKGIMLAHTLGNPFNLKKIREICTKYNLWLIEDSCDALGSTYENKNIGTFGDLSTLSFYPAHHITMGEGGAVMTNSKKLEIIAKSFRDWGRDCYCETGKDNTCNKRFDWKLGELPEGYDHKYIYSHIGYNLKITDMQAACGLGQLDKLQNFVSARRNNFKYLYKNLKKFESFFILPEAEKNSNPSWFGFPLSVRENKYFDRNELIRYLNNEKIGTRLLFSGNLTKQPYMKGQNYKIYGNLKNSDFIMNHTFWIGIYPGLTSKHLDYVVKKFEIFFKLKNL